MERYVEIRKRAKDGKSTVKLGEFVLRDGASTVEFVGDPSKVRGLIDRDGAIFDRLGILNKPNKRGKSRVDKTDGAAFLENLPLNIWGAMVWAIKVKERKTSK